MPRGSMMGGECLAYVAPRRGGHAPSLRRTLVVCTGAVGGGSDDCCMVKEIVWVGGRLVEVVSGIAAGIIAYFVLVRDPDMPVTPDQEPFVMWVFVIFVSFAVFGACMTRAADRMVAAPPPGRRSGGQLARRSRGLLTSHRRERALVRRRSSRGRRIAGRAARSKGDK